MELKRVVVTGMGAITPLGNNVPDYWNGLINGVSGADMITLFDASKFRTKFACEVKGFDPVQHLDKKEARKIDRFTQFALVTSDQAMQDAGCGVGVGVARGAVGHQRLAAGLAQPLENRSNAAHGCAPGPPLTSCPRHDGRQ